MRENTKQPETTDAHPFGGCRQLLSHYRTIGRSLLTYEAQAGAIRSMIAMGRVRTGASLEASASFQSFSHSLAFVPVEVLESYLEDLLNSEINDAALAIDEPRSHLRESLITGSGMVLSLALGGYASWIGTGILLALLITVFMALPFGVYWYFLPRESFLRRLVFSHLLNHEISRRRGGGIGTMTAVGI